MARWASSTDTGTQPWGDDEDGWKRFDRERRALGAVCHHPHIVTVFRSGRTDHDQPYLVMENCPRGSLADELRRNGPLP